MQFIRSLIAEWRKWQEEQARPCYRQMGVALAHPDLLPYPVDMSLLLVLEETNLDKDGVLYRPSSGDTPAIYHPSNIAHYALAHWNAYLLNGAERHKDAFLTQVAWLLDHEVCLSKDLSVWPISFAVPTYYAPQTWLSALTQGSVISVLVRAHQLMGEETFLHVSRRALAAFERDVLDGGISIPFGNDGSIFFEEVAVYPAAHILNGYFLALFGLYDYVTLVQKDGKARSLIDRSVTALHTVLEEFDAGYWTRYDLLHKRLASWFYHSLHITLLEIFARYSGCEHCMKLADRWARYQRSFFCRFRYLLTSRMDLYYEQKILPWLRLRLFKTETNNASSSPEHVCVPLTAFPLPGDSGTVLTSVAKVMEQTWQLTYLAQQKEQDTGEIEVTTFGKHQGRHERFPGVWFYCLTGGWKLFQLLRHTPHYKLLLPQDGIFTAAFTTMLGKLAGVRVVCMEQGEILLLDSPALRKERIAALHQYPWLQRIWRRLLYIFYWPSLRLMANFVVRHADAFLVAGEEVAQVYRKRFKVHPGRIIHYTYMVDFARFSAMDKAAKLRLRVGRGIAKDAIIISMMNPLIPEKGLSFALEGISLALSNLPPNIRTRIKVLIAGDGPLQAQIEADIKSYNLDFVCMLCGEAKPDELTMLLGMSDIFLYSGIRGSNYVMSVLEAMAAGCAVVATRTPQAHTKLLADGRGISIMPESAVEIGVALTHLCVDLDLCHHMGQKAREYVIQHHSAEMLKRSLLRASYYAPSMKD